MPASHLDLFGTTPPADESPDDEFVADVRSRLHATLALVKSAEAMPWKDMLAIIREDDAFRYAKGFLPPAEGAALWAEFDAEMNRLDAIINEGNGSDLAPGAK